VPLPVDLQTKIAERLRLALGLMETAEITSFSSEYDLRNSFSRMYYAFFHASVALLLATDADIEKVCKNHGMLHERLQRKFGKTMIITRLIRELYDLRRDSDYETNMFASKYSGNIEEARKDSILLSKRAKTQFFWIYNEARRFLTQK
jgi:uncharacterized protein (UPF0332 family)